MTILYRSGRTQLHAVFLTQDLEFGEIARGAPGSTVASNDLALSDNVTFYEELRKNPLHAPVVNYLLRQRSDTNPQIVRVAKLLAIVDGILCRRNNEVGGTTWLLVVTMQLHQDIMQAYHGDRASGHFGLFKTYFRIRKHFFSGNECIVPFPAPSFAAFLSNVENAPSLSGSVPL